MKPSKLHGDLSLASEEQLRSFWNANDPPVDDFDPLPSAIVEVAAKAPAEALVRCVMATRWEPTPFSYGFDVVLHRLDLERVAELSRLFLTADQGGPVYLPDGYRFLGIEDFAQADRAWQQNLGHHGRILALGSLWESASLAVGPYIKSLLPFPEFLDHVLERVGRRGASDQLLRLTKNEFPPEWIARCALVMAKKADSRPREKMTAAAAFGDTWYQHPYLPSSLVSEAISLFRDLQVESFERALERNTVRSKLSEASNGRGLLMAP